jgi:DNA-binding beta-propeller fold protein YncE
MYERKKGMITTGAFGASGSGLHQFNGPTGIAVDAAGKIYVVDSGNHRIVRMDDMSGSG